MHTKSQGNVLCRISSSCFVIQEMNYNEIYIYELRTREERGKIRKTWRQRDNKKEKQNRRRMLMDFVNY